MFCLSTCPEQLLSCTTSNCPAATSPARPCQLPNHVLQADLSGRKTRTLGNQYRWFYKITLMFITLHCNPRGQLLWAAAVGSCCQTECTLTTLPPRTQHVLLRSQVLVQRPKIHVAPRFQAEPHGIHLPLDPFCSTGTPIWLSDPILHKYVTSACTLTSSQKLSGK